jgi:rhamnose utilization protein RhaD (predicted bifunctional aldolase and dehydrogenase)
MKFMAVPNYTYLKLKMLGPHGVTTVGSSFQRSYEREVECCELAAATIASAELATIKADTAEDHPDAKQSVSSFEPAEDTKVVQIDPDNALDKVVRIDATLSPK